MQAALIIFFILSMSSKWDIKTKNKQKHGKQALNSPS